MQFACDRAPFLLETGLQRTRQFTDGSIGANTYHWDFGDGGTSTEASPAHTYATNGNYTVCLTITGDCGDATACQAIGISVGISAAGGKSHLLSIAPSPANDRFMVRSEGAAIVQVQLLDADGRLVSVTDQTHGTNLMVPVAHLPAGMYAARVRLSDGSMEHRRVVVAH